jgi:hypothetical protein
MPSNWTQEQLEERLRANPHVKIAGSPSASRSLVGEETLAQAGGAGESPKTSTPNKTETRFENDYLKRWQAEGLVARYGFALATLVLFEAFREKGARRTRYTPDWYCVRPTGRLLFVEVKGAYAFEGALDKLKAAARLYPEHEFLLARWKGGAWTLLPVSAGQR